MNVLIINLATATERLEFQQEQMARLNLSYQVMQAVTVEQIKPQAYRDLGHGWERPLRKTELACFLSHHNAWQTVKKCQAPMLIIEDDAVLVRQTPLILASLEIQTACDLVNLEVRSRKKIVGKALPLLPHFKLLPLYQDRTGAAAYVLWPSGAEILTQKAQNECPALADNFIASTYPLRRYQIEPAAAIQLDQCECYGIKPALITQSFIEAEIKPYHDSEGLWEGLTYKGRQIRSKLQSSYQHISTFWRSEERHIDLNPQNFQ